MSTSLKKGLTRVKSSINKTANKLAAVSSASSTSTPSSSTTNALISAITSVATTSTNIDSSSSPMTQASSSANLQADADADADHLMHHFALKYEDLPSRKRNFSQTNSISSNPKRLPHQRTPSNSSHRSTDSQHSTNSTHHVEMALPDTTQETVLIDDPLNTVLEDIPPSASQLHIDTASSFQEGNDSLLPPVPNEISPPCDNDQLSPIVPTLVSPLAETAHHEALHEENSRQFSTSSAPLATGRNGLRPSVVSAMSLPLALSSTSSAHPNSSQTRSNSDLAITHNEDDIADAMAISILEKVPHHTKEIGIDDWTI